MRFWPFPVTLSMYILGLGCLRVENFTLPVRHMNIDLGITNLLGAGVRTCFGFRPGNDFLRFDEFFFSIFCLLLLTYFRLEFEF